eukprot:13971-Eustigmatos_ZCMA.PRE.1
MLNVEPPSQIPVTGMSGASRRVGLVPESDVARGLSLSSQQPPGCRGSFGSLGRRTHRKCGGGHRDLRSVPA